MFTKEEVEKEDMEKVQAYYADLKEAAWVVNDPETLIALLKVEPENSRLRRLTSAALRYGTTNKFVLHELCWRYLRNKDAREKYGRYIEEILALLPRWDIYYAVRVREDHLFDHINAIEIAMYRQYNVGLAKSLLKSVPEKERLELIVEANQHLCASEPFLFGSTRVNDFMRFEEQLEQEGMLPKLTSEQKKAIKKEVNKACVVARTCDMCTIF